jgi:hypothetical protein
MKYHAQTAIHYHTATAQLSCTDRVQLPHINCYVPRKKCDPLPNNHNSSTTHGPRCSTKDPMLKIHARAAFNYHTATLIYHARSVIHYHTATCLVPLTDHDGLLQIPCSSTTQEPRSITTNPLISTTHDSRSTTTQLLI